MRDAWKAIRLDITDSSGFQVCDPQHAQPDPRSPATQAHAWPWHQRTRALGASFPTVPIRVPAWKLSGRTGVDGELLSAPYLSLLGQGARRPISPARQRSRGPRLPVGGHKPLGFRTVAAASGRALGSAGCGGRRRRGFRTRPGAPHRSPRAISRLRWAPVLAPELPSENCALFCAQSRQKIASVRHSGAGPMLGAGETRLGAEIAAGPFPAAGA